MLNKAENISVMRGGSIYRLFQANYS